MKAHHGSKSQRASHADVGFFLHSFSVGESFSAIVGNGDADVDV